jgi:L-threonylcarbamoyladenylate synthase
VKGISLTKNAEPDLARAARLIRAGKLVAFPTETVYGLGANALDAEAVDRIYLVKGRPPTSPLIVHVDGVEMAKTIVSVWPPAAQLLADRFWPGALTLVLPKHAVVPDRVTAGLATVGVRVPAHALAIALIRAAGVPIAAPSANRFTELSATTAEHVRRSLGRQVAMILDGGSTQVGIESTVLSLAGLQPLLLRPGMISLADIESVIGPVGIGGTPESGAHASPGLHRKHYSPKTRLILIDEGALPTTGRGAYIFVAVQAQAERVVRMPEEPAAYAAKLYAVLHDLDRQELDWIAVERPPSTPAWAAIADRLRRAAS